MVASASARRLSSPAPNGRGLAPLALHCPGIDSELFGNDAHTGPPRSRQRVRDSFSRAEVIGGHPRRFRSSWSPVTAARTRLTAILPPEVAEAGRRKFGIANRVLDVLVAKPCLERPRVVAGIGKRIAAAMPQHVRVDRKRHLGPSTDPAEQRVPCLRRHRSVPFGHKHVA